MRDPRKKYMFLQVNTYCKHSFANIFLWFAWTIMTRFCCAWGNQWYLWHVHNTQRRERVITLRVKLCQMQHQDDKKSFPNPPLPLNGVSWQLQGFSLREMSKITLLLHFSEDGGRMHLAWEHVRSPLPACKSESIQVPWCWTTVKMKLFCWKAYLKRKCCSWVLACFLNRSYWTCWLVLIVSPIDFILSAVFVLFL